ncbi:MAG: TetR/AcrR family transcriptional regulator [Solirubrobacteraceae bacterium]
MTRKAIEAVAGLRERKKQQTRKTIEQVALRLFADRGYENTTLAEIADAANVSRRTIFAYFDSKEDILFCEEQTVQERLRQALAERAAGTTTVDVLRDFLANLEEPNQEMKLRKQIVGSSESLRQSARARSGPIEELIAASIATDLGAGADDIRPPILAASIRAAVTAARDRIEADGGEPVSHEQALAILDEVLEFLRGGLEALQRRTDAA